MTYMKTVATFNEGDRVRPKDSRNGCQQGTVKAASDTGHAWVHWDGDRQPYTAEADKIELVPKIPEFDEIWVSQYGTVLRIIGILPEANGYEPVVVYVYDESTPRGTRLGEYALCAEPLSVFVGRATKKASR